MLDSPNPAQSQELSEAQKWRRRYEVEAQQRRKEYKLAQETIQQLRAEVQQLCQLRPNSAPSLPPATSSAQATLAEVEAERDRLAAALAQEQAAHARTRDNLIDALNDAMAGRHSGAAALPEARP